VEKRQSFPDATSDGLSREGSPGDIPDIPKWEQRGGSVLAAILCQEPWGTYFPTIWLAIDHQGDVLHGSLGAYPNHKGNGTMLADLFNDHSIPEEIPIPMDREQNVIRFPEGRLDWAEIGHDSLSKLGR